MATIQLGQEILVVEALIDDRNHDLAFRQLMQVRDKYARRPEFKYLQALFDATFLVRSDRELMREVSALVAEQPDFSEAVALLAFLHERTGDHARAEVFAREASRSVNPRAQARARLILNPGAIAQGAIPSPTTVAAPVAPETVNDQLHLRAQQSALPTPPIPSFSGPFRFDANAVTTPPNAAAPPAKAAERVRTRQLGSASPDASTHWTASRSSGRTPSPIPASGWDESSIPSASNPAGAHPSLSETIDFSPSGSMPPPPTVPPVAGPNEAGAILPDPDAISAYGFLQRDQDKRKALSQPHSEPPDTIPKVPTPAPDWPPTHRTTTSQAGHVQRARSAPDLSVDYAGIDPRTSRVSRPGISIAPPVEVQRQWFRYARAHQVSAREGEGESTAHTLLELAEHVMEGLTPLSPDPVPLERKGLILIEQRLETFRSARGTVSAAERAATTSAAAFLLAVLMKETEAKAVDTTPEDGACKAVLRSGTSVRPLLVAAGFVRGRGPGLVETFDRAATAHMQRTPRPPSAPPPKFPQPELDTQPIHSGAPRARRTALSVPRRDLDAGTLCLVDPAAPAGPSPQANFHLIAESFWTSPEGRAVATGSRRVGTFTLADVDALERHATRTISLVGSCPPGSPWPWVPSEELQRQVFVWGAILGEVLVSVYTGRWEADPTDSADRQLHRVVLAGTVMAWPMAKVYLRIARGVSHDLSAYVDVVGRIVGRQAARTMSE